MATKKLHKTLLVLILVILPPYFLIFTGEGRRISDNVILWLFGAKSISLNLAELDSGYRSEDIRKVFPDLEWQCPATRTDLGDSLCTAPIGSFNDYPSRQLVAYFENDRLSAVKILYREPYHAEVLGHLIEQLGQPRNVADAIKATPDAAEVLEWKTGSGVIVLKRELHVGDEAAMFWMSDSR